jgi:hypothetical protein
MEHSKILTYNRIVYNISFVTSGHAFFVWTNFKGFIILRTTRETFRSR